MDTIKLWVHCYMVTARCYTDGCLYHFVHHIYTTNILQLNQHLSKIFSTRTEHYDLPKVELIPGLLY